MSAQLNIRTSDMPAEMRILLEDYPRDSWPDHAGFKDKTRQWLGAHQMFRQTGEAVRVDIENYIDGNTDPKAAVNIEALQRHLSDEEELAVPIILHHRLRG